MPEPDTESHAKAYTESHADSYHSEADAITNNAAAFHAVTNAFSDYTKSYLESQYTWGVDAIGVPSIV